ncbi:GNAT family N-acetyltransferase, partial [Phenylobacterium sp.]|uniref:GNAT family N-acetyltransferase n=1 Tax=Phenylobacterium sp. TaxID=1871053 RepID=UPI0037C7241C
PTRPTRHKLPLGPSSCLKQRDPLAPTSYLQVWMGLPQLRDVTRWVVESQALALAGEALLIVNLDAEGVVAGYSRITVWPDRSAAELAGAIRADRQNSGQGGRGMAHSFGWIFETLGVRMMCLTAALDNIRVQKGIDAAGFTRMGERDTVRPDGTTRRSIYWEMMREDWRMRHRL